MKVAAVLATGATGYLGGYLVRELLERTAAQVYCLVRGSDPAASQERLLKRLRQLPSWNSELETRITAVPGDLKQPNLGIAPERYGSLAEEIDAIYHSGADVNFIRTYPSVKAGTVGGTREILRLAATSKTKAVHHVSSMAVFGAPAYLESEMVYEDDPLRDGSGLRVGYFQSKWVSERLVMAAGERGIPGCIYRPSLITGHTVTGDCKLDDLLPLMIQGCIRLGLAPSFEDLVIDFLPVDVLSRIIVHLSGRPESLGKAFNLVNPDRLPWPRLFDIIRSLGYTVHAIPYREWLDVLRTSSSSNALVQMLPFFDRMDERLFASPRLDSRNMQEGIAGIDLGSPPVEDLFKLYLGYFARMGLIPAPGVRGDLASAGGAD